MIYTIDFTLTGDDGHREDLTRRTAAEGFDAAVDTITRTYGNSVVIESVSLKGLPKSSLK